MNTALGPHQHQLLLQVISSHMQEHETLPWMTLFDRSRTDPRVREEAINADQVRWTLFDLINRGTFLLSSEREVTWSQRPVRSGEAFLRPQTSLPDPALEPQALAQTLLQSTPGDWTTEDSEIGWALLAVQGSHMQPIPLIRAQTRAGSAGGHGPTVHDATLIRLARELARRYLDLLGTVPSQTQPYQLHRVVLEPRWEVGRLPDQATLRSAQRAAVADALEWLEPTRPALTPACRTVVERLRDSVLLEDPATGWAHLEANSEALGLRYVLQPTVPSGR